MTAKTVSDLIDLVGRQRPGWSLEQAFYLDPSIYEFEQSHWLPRQWSLMGHISEIPLKGDRIVRSLFGEEIIIVRAGPDDIRAFYNVCTHRGSRICKEDGRAPLLTCPYHAWSFHLTGELRSTKDLPEDVDPTELGLHPVPMRETGGLIFCGLDEGKLPDFAPAAEALAPALAQHGIAQARVVARRSYPTNANWKLVVENFLECYHCRPAHPEYFRVNGHVKVTAMRDETRAAEWQEELQNWIAAPSQFDFHHPITVEGDLEHMPYGVYRKPIGGGRATLSSDGLPVSTPMGILNGHDGAETAFRFGRLSFIGAVSDYVTLIEIKPRGVDSTDVILTWLVDEKAEPENIDAIAWMWDVTTVQDKRIVEENAAGVRSSAYRPGPYTPLETQTDWFVRTYLGEVRHLAGGSAATPIKAPAPVGYADAL